MGCHYVMIYLNPLVAMSQLITCLNREVIAHLVLYWLISISAVLMVGGSCCGYCDTAGCTLDRTKKQPQQQQQQAENTTSQQQQHRSNKAASKNRDKNGESNAKTTSKSDNQQTQDCTEEEAAGTSEQQQQQQHRNGSASNSSKTKSKSNSRHTDDCIEQETTCCTVQQQQHHSDEKSKKTSNHKHSRQHDKQTDRKHHDKNGSKSNVRSKSTACNNSQFYDDNTQNDTVVSCGYDTCVHQDETNADNAKQWQCCKVSRSQQNDGANCSSNAKDDDSDDCRIESVVRAFRLSQLTHMHAATVRFDDEGRPPGEHDEYTACRRTTESRIESQCWPRTASLDDGRQWKKDGERKYSEDNNSLTITRSGTGETKPRRPRDNSWSRYYEDRCSEFNDSDESDEQPEQQA